MPLDQQYSLDGGWIARRMTANCNFYMVYLNPAIHANSAIPMTGGAVTRQINIPFPHRIIRIELTHLVAALTVGTDATAVIVTCEQGTHPQLPKMYTALLNIAAWATSSRIEVFGEGYEYDSRIWQISLNTTNTDLVIPVFYIQIVGIGGY